MIAMLKYIELKTGHHDNGPAWIGYVKMSKTGRTLYFNGRALHRLKKGSIAGNYMDLETREEFWVSGIKKNGQDRHWAGSGKIRIEATAVADYLTLMGTRKLAAAKYEVFEDTLLTDGAKFHRLENDKRPQDTQDDPWLVFAEALRNAIRSGEGKD